MAITIIRYTAEWKMRWDKFVNASKNGTFLFCREYMEYHSDRFNDFSLIALNETGNILALLPANCIDDIIYSHGGLTYGGWIMPHLKFNVLTMLEIWEAMTDTLTSHGIKSLIYKPIPYIYNCYPSEEDIYAIFRANGQLTASLISSVIDLKSPIEFDQNARRSMKASSETGVIFRKNDDYSHFWEILTDLLQRKYSTNPVHSLEEISRLKLLFPQNIHLYEAVADNKVIAGCVIYDTPQVGHAQYIASTQQGRELKVLPSLFAYIINENKSKWHYFDFGTSNEDGGKYLNEGLIRQKCGMGGRAVVYNTYRINF